MIGRGASGPHEEERSRVRHTLGNIQLETNAWKRSPVTHQYAAIRESLSRKQKKLWVASLRNDSSMRMNKRSECVAEGFRLLLHRAVQTMQ